MRLQASGIGLRVASLAVVAALAGPAAADVKPRDPEKGPDAQGSGAEAPDPQKVENPLPGIVERMKEAERRLAETETGRWTQDEQRRIVEALELEGKAVEGLTKLIEQIESSPP